MGLFKKNNNSDYNAEPRCEYCKFGKQARTAGKILCTKMGIVSVDSGCKKFKYSLTRYTESLKRHDPGAVSDKTAAAAEPKVPPQEAPMPKPVVHTESSAAAKETPKAAEPQTPPQEVPIQAKPSAPPQPESKPETSVSDIHIPFERLYRAVNAEIPDIGGIKNAASDNSERIKRLYENALPTVGGISIDVPKKEIILPNAKESDVSGINISTTHESAEKRLEYVNIPAISDMK